MGRPSGLAGPGGSGKSHVLTGEKVGHVVGFALQETGSVSPAPALPLRLTHMDNDPARLCVGMFGDVTPLEHHDGNPRQDRGRQCAGEDRREECWAGVLGSSNGPARPDGSARCENVVLRI